ncbi:MAG TPA: UvrB/UvrC motif-containing protein [Devosiaceae bacterium]|jgi:hypothetical protein|nr:UvrB/UvrC motif-containing protein [Devosiaceae bacterium]
MSLSAIERRIAALTREMMAAAAEEDFELASRLRDEIAELKGQAPGSQGGEVEVRQPPPGQMGLGTHIPVAAPPKGWKPPRKPDPLTRGTRRGGSRGR